jgi:hypothetical protein
MSSRVILTDTEIKAIVSSLEYYKYTISKEYPNVILGNAAYDKLLKKLRQPKEANQ